MEGNIILTHCMKLTIASIALELKYMVVLKCKVNLETKTGSQKQFDKNWIASN